MELRLRSLNSTAQDYQAKKLKEINEWKRLFEEIDQQSKQNLSRIEEEAEVWNITSQVLLQEPSQFIRLNRLAYAAFHPRV